MSFSIGIVGLPNVGKSTLFQALTKKQVDCSNYPFCTVEPNHGIVAVPDERLLPLYKVTRSEKVIPTTIEFVDIAGLVRGAHKGEGLGNQFLSHIREVDAIAHVVRAFQDSNVSHIHGGKKPAEDIEIVNFELISADLEIVNQRFIKLEKEIKAGASGEQTKQKDILSRLITILQAGRPARSIDLGGLQEEGLAFLSELHLLTLKPVIYVFNMDEERTTNNANGQSPTNITNNANGQSPANITNNISEKFVSLSAKLEAELAELTDEERKEYMKELGISESGIDKLIKTSYNSLDLITFFTFNENETRAWTIKKGAKAPHAAGKIHTDFERGFIRVEVINWKELVEVGGMSTCGGSAVGGENARKKGLVRIEGKEYVVQDGEVCYFRHQ